MTNAIEKVKKLQSELNAIIVERESEIEGSLAAILARAHVLFLGPPGTAKSMLANQICGAIDGGNFFEWLLTKFSTPEELFGPLSLKGLKEDQYRRVTTKKLPEATIAFLDEIFKANSAILNSLLTAINERKFHNDGVTMQLPLISCFGGSNELPKGEELGALYDRFLLRFWVKEIQDDSNFTKLLTGAVGEGTPTVRLTVQEITELQGQVEKIKISAEVIETIRNVQRELQTEKGITASDRRWKSAVRVLKAFALLRGRTEVALEDLESLADMMWRDPAERKAIFEVVAKRSNPLNLKAVEILDEAKEAYDKWVKATDPKQRQAIAIDSNNSFKETMKEINGLLMGKDNDPRAKKLREVRDQIKQYQASLIKFMMG